MSTTDNTTQETEPTDTDDSPLNSPPGDPLHTPPGRRVTADPWILLYEARQIANGDPPENLAFPENKNVLESARTQAEASKGVRPEDVVSHVPEITYAQPGETLDDPE